MLGPLFFVIFISDLPEVVLPGNTIALHADDCKCSEIIDAADDQDLFQEDLDSFFQWSVQNCINLNVQKCKIMTLTKKKHPYISKFTLNNYRLDEVKEFKDWELLPMSTSHGTPMLTVWLLRLIECFV